MRQIEIFGNITKRRERETFVCYFLGKLRFESGDLHNSRMHSQPNRIYSAMGIHPTLSSSETLGRYWIAYVEEY